MISKKGTLAMPQKEAAEFGPHNIYHPEGGEMLWKYYLPQLKDDVIDTVLGIKDRLKPSRILAGIGGLGTVAAPVIIDSFSAHVEAAPAFQGPTVGGRGFGIGSVPNGIMIDWLGGTGQTSYDLYKLAASGITRFPRSGSLPKISTQYMVPSIDIAPDTVACFVLVPYGPSGPLGNSDPLCVIRDIALGAAAGNLSIRLNESNLASFTWLHPVQGGHDGYHLIPLSGVPRGPVDLPATATSYTHDTLGAPTCYTLATMRAGIIIGFTDLLCGIPGKSRFPSALATLTPTPPGPVASTRTPTATETLIIILPSPTRTPALSPTASPTRTPEFSNYYSRYRDMAVFVEANQQVNDQDFQNAVAVVSDMIGYSADYRDRLRRVQAGLALFPGRTGGRLTDLPQFMSLRGQSVGGLLIDDAQLLAWAYNGHPIVGVRDEYASTYPGGIIHEVASSFMYVFTTAELEDVTNSFNNATSRGLYPGTYAMRNVSDYWSEMSRSFLGAGVEYGGPTAICRQDSIICGHLTSAYGPR